ncbi:hypothetical protein CSQ85_07950 [Bifidobacterium rousetti]|uniref:hypothetical protein n=1 Tax=Bifidobacterium rousetti TaxID=2045439 RepID=UPI001239F885|nr:hypothetical protein [Bifidobacterium rousetti]KAA8818433.1 hypothetical protein CSQ85_07950 [Bifidobacterium rousetti]
MHRTRKPRGGDARGGVTVSVFVLLAAMLLSVGLGAGFLLTRSRIPQSLESSEPAGSMKVAASRFDDARSVQLTVTLGTSSTIMSPVAGTVTASRCATNAVVASGGAPISVDAIPVLALHTGTPPYRTLTSGTKGPDARALNDALRSLGYAAPDSDWFTWNSITAYNKLADSVGARRITKEGGWAIDPSFFIWLPSASATVAECRVSVGRQITQGAELLVTSAAPVKAALPAGAATGDLVAGDRVLTIGSTTVPIPAGTAELTDPGVLAAITGSTEYRLASLGGGSGQMGAGGGTGASGSGSGVSGGEGGTVQVSYTWRLAQPIEAVTVPPSSLYRASGGKACVTVSGKPTSVTIIASQLGKTMVAPDGVDSFSSVDVSPASDAACRG